MCEVDKFAEISNKRTAEESGDYMYRERAEDDSKSEERDDGEGNGFDRNVKFSLRTCT